MDTQFNLAASTDVEHAFSKGHLTVSRLHHSLYDKSTHAVTVLGSWASISELLSDEELVRVIKEKQFQWGKETDAIVID
jgi:hypothetical protein